MRYGRCTTVNASETTHELGRREYVFTADARVKRWFSFTLRCVFCIPKSALGGRAWTWVYYRATERHATPPGFPRVVGFARTRRFSYTVKHDVWRRTRYKRKIIKKNKNHEFDLRERYCFAAVSTNSREPKRRSNERTGPVKRCRVRGKPVADLVERASGTVPRPRSSSDCVAQIKGLVPIRWRQIELRNFQTRTLYVRFAVNLIFNDCSRKKCHWRDRNEQKSKSPNIISPQHGVASGIQKPFFFIAS